MASMCGRVNAHPFSFYVSGSIETVHLPTLLNANRQCTAPASTKGIPGNSYSQHPLKHCESFRESFHHPSPEHHGESAPDSNSNVNSQCFDKWQSDTKFNNQCFDKRQSNTKCSSDEPEGLRSVLKGGRKWVSDSLARSGGPGRSFQRKVHFDFARIEYIEPELVPEGWIPQWEDRWREEEEWESDDEEEWNPVGNFLDYLETVWG
eukprot:gnl/MRDRNA2_/MRDRNA2_96877_c0_seq1.p1 gnl/MRDRNA2_/MRDRNA2_96877_c0~~gnl/MRDRNA2_/MRDRNA2_96877_c0_seq1.p1  ORF type:complete len:206 (-),score=16.89 gnl/MRDRNA2_/MRDRNA2_96877_c0_seq1:705-1322(-)